MSKEIVKGKRVSVGIINLTGHQKVQLQEGQAQGALFKRALILFEGTFHGQFGEVKITPDFLGVMQERFNREFANPKNMFDYPPLLVDHDRKADLIKGRLVGPMSLEPWEDPRDGVTKMSLWSDVRVDDEEAQGKVIKGQYAHLSLSFDDDINNLAEVFELSFVAVEAARGAQALQKGEKMSVELQKNLDSAKSKITALKAKAKTRRTVLLAACASLSQNLEAMTADHKKGTEGLKATVTSLKMTVVTSQLKACVKEGRLSKADFDKLDVTKIAEMEPSAQTVILSSYQTRPISTDLIQHGMSGAKPLSEKGIQLTDGQMAKAIKLQREGKNFEAGEVTQPESENLTSDDGNDDDRDPELTGKDIEEALAKLEGLAALQDKIGESSERMKKLLASLQGEDKDDENEED